MVHLFRYSHPRGCEVVPNEVQSQIRVTQDETDKKYITFIFDSTILEGRIHWESNRPANATPWVSQTYPPRHRQHGATNSFHLPSSPPPNPTHTRWPLYNWEHGKVERRGSSCREVTSPKKRERKRERGGGGIPQSCPTPSHQLGCSSDSEQEWAREQEEVGVRKQSKERTISLPSKVEGSGGGSISLSHLTLLAGEELFYKQKRNRSMSQHLELTVHLKGI